jgi:hypothetical protein
VSRIQQVAAFANDLDNLIERYEQEFDLTYVEVIGVLHLKTHLLCTDAAADDDEDAEVGDGEDSG